MQAAKLQLSTRILTKVFELKEEVPFIDTKRVAGIVVVLQTLPQYVNMFLHYDVTINIIICFFKMGKR